MEYNNNLRSRKKFLSLIGFTFTLELLYTFSFVILNVFLCFCLVFTIYAWVDRWLSSTLLFLMKKFIDSILKKRQVSMKLALGWKRILPSVKWALCSFPSNCSGVEKYTVWTAE